MPRARILSLLVLSGCIGFALCIGFIVLLPAPVPMPQVRYALDKSKRAPCLVVLLPGRGDALDAFEKNGFIADLRARNIQADLLTAGATFGYYARRTFPERFAKDILQPLRKEGYPRIWAIGVSVGAFGASLYSKDNPGVFGGMLLIAPYLGESGVQDEIHNAGGLTAWSPASVGKDDYERAIWLWLKRTAERDPEIAPEGPQLYLGFGEQDRMAPAHELLAAALPANHVFRTPGGHNWPVWRTVWRQFLEDLAISCSAAGNQY